MRDRHTNIKNTMFFLNALYISFIFNFVIPLFFLDTLYMKGKKEPNRKEKEIGDIVDLNARLDGLLPTFLMKSADFKRNPQLESADDNIENVSHKVNMLESCIINLANKVSEDNRALKEEIRNSWLSGAVPQPLFQFSMFQVASLFY
jgi:hypothetical protein